MSAGDNVQVGVLVDREMHRRLKYRSIDEGRSVSEIGRQLFAEYLSTDVPADGGGA